MKAGAGTALKVAIDWNVHQDPKDSRYKTPVNTWAKKYHIALSESTIKKKKEFQYFLAFNPIAVVLVR